jgi:Arc/MetJ family transcription regulator
VSLELAISNVYNRKALYTSETGVRTNIDIDEKLIQEAMALSGEKTKKSVVEEGLRRLIRLERQKKSLEQLRGIGWEGDLEKMRLGWSAD